MISLRYPEHAYLRRASGSHPSSFIPSCSPVADPDLPRDHTKVLGLQHVGFAALNELADELDIGVLQTLDDRTEFEFVNAAVEFSFWRIALRTRFVPGSASSSKLMKI